MENPTVSSDDLAQALEKMIEVAETYHRMLYLEFRHPKVTITPREAVIKARCVAILKEYKAQTEQAPSVIKKD